LLWEGTIEEIERVVKTEEERAGEKGKEVLNSYPQSSFPHFARK